MLEELYTTRQVSEKLHIHINTLYRYIDEGKLKAVRMGGLVRIKECDIKEFLSQSLKERRDVTADKG